MLLELRVENLLLIERAELRLEPGLNVITGETGAGKTVLAHALDLLLGGKPRPGIVRPGAPEAYVEGVFSIPDGLLSGDAMSDLRERLPDDLDEIVLGRRVGAEGRTRAFVQGRSASAADLRELGGRLLSFYGQHEHRRLTLASAQLDILDAFCGPAHAAVRERYAACHTRVRSLRAALDELRARTGARDRDRDLLAFELDEIEGLGPDVEEEAALLAERGRLRQIDGLRAAAGAGAEAIAPEDGGLGAGMALGEAERLADAVAGADAELDVLAERLRAVRIEADDLGAELRRYASGLEAEPGRLEEVEARLEQYDRLRRKHGGSVESVLAHAELCRAELARLERSDDDEARTEAELEPAVDEEGGLARKLSKARAAAAPKLAERVLDELAQLAMEGAEFAVELQPREELGPAGAERVEFVIAPNPGVPAMPLRETASGGETSRAMLALLTAAGAAGDTTLVFDEVDAGIGGQTARAVGERLRALAERRQIVCITHLPQIASLARRHFRIEKSAETELARTTVEALDDGDLVAELCRMLGADTSDAGARRHAEELLAAA
ncbi:MAG: repair protein RecN [Thermoleophilaceae bacterium]|nr:repair protein RecN [Thermoleophilaceae bacterium]MEA2469222.1 repair protein RecN [Thermoleophilaceae bacterium]